MTNISRCGGGEADPNAPQRVGSGKFTFQRVTERHVDDGGERIVDGQIWLYRGVVGNVATNGLVWAHERQADLEAQNMLTGERVINYELPLEDGHDLTVTVGVRDALARALGRHLPDGWLATEDIPEEHTAQTASLH